MNTIRKRRLGFYLGYTLGVSLAAVALSLTLWGLAAIWVGIGHTLG